MLPTTSNSCINSLEPQTSTRRQSGLDFCLLYLIGSEFYFIWLDGVPSLVRHHTPFNLARFDLYYENGAVWALGSQDAIPVVTVCMFYILYASYFHLLATIMAWSSGHCMA
jgi:hypothetical protein